MTTVAHIVYQTTNMVNGKVYVGYHRTTDVHDDYLGSGILLNKAIRKYGRDNFVKNVLHVFEDEHSARQKEAEIVNEEFVEREDTYNLNVGGYGSNYHNVSRGLCHTPEANEKRRVWLKEFYETPEGEALKEKNRKRMLENNPTLDPEVRAKCIPSLLNLKGVVGEAHPTYRKVTALNLLTKETEKISKEEYDKSPIHTSVCSAMKIIMDDQVFYNHQLAVDYLWETRKLNGTPFKAFFRDNKNAILNDTKIANKKTSAVSNYHGSTWSALGITLLEYNPKTEAINEETLYGYQD